jgi:hypothetical protein
MKKSGEEVSVTPPTPRNLLAYDTRRTTMNPGSLDKKVGEGD